MTAGRNEPTGKAYYKSLWKQDCTLRDNIKILFEAEYDEYVTRAANGFFDKQASKLNIEAEEIWQQVLELLNDDELSEKGFFTVLCKLYSERNKLRDPNNEAILRINYAISLIQKDNPDLVSHSQHRRVLAY